MEELNEINKHDHVIVHIWGTGGGGGRGPGHVALQIHDAADGEEDFMEDTFVSLWPGYLWQESYNDAFEDEHDHGPTNVLVFYNLDVNAMLGRFETLKMKTKNWIMVPTKKEASDIEGSHNNCCTAAWKVLSAGQGKGYTPLLSDKMPKIQTSSIRSQLSGKGLSQLPGASGRFFGGKSEGKDSRHIMNDSNGPSWLFSQAILSGERYGPDFILEILTKAKTKEVEQMHKDDPNDPRLALTFGGHNTVNDKDGAMLLPKDNAQACAVETEKYTAANILANTKVAKTI